MDIKFIKQCDKFSYMAEIVGGLAHTSHLFQLCRVFVCVTLQDEINLVLLENVLFIKDPLL